MRKFCSIDGLVQLFGQGILWFWALWFTLAFFGDIVDIGQLIGWLPKELVGSSSNFDYQLGITKTRITDWQINFSLYLVIVFWVMLGWFFHMRAALTSYYHPQWMARTLQAFFVSIGMYFGFIVGDEFFIAYVQEHDHMNHAVIEMMTLLVILATQQWLGRSKEVL